MRILAISEHSWPKQGGTATYVEQIIKGLEAAGNRVHLVRPLPGNKRMRRRPRLPCASTEVLVPDKLFDTRRGRRFFARAAAERLPGIVRRFKPDVIHVLYGHQVIEATGSFHGALPIVWTVTNVPPAEYSLTVTGIPQIDVPIRKGYFTVAGWVHRRRMRAMKFDKMVCISNYTRRAVIRIGIQPWRVVAIPLGVDVVRFKPRSDRAVGLTRIRLGLGGRFVILTVAGVVPHKGQEQALRAVAIVRERMPEILFVNIGPVRDSGYFRRLQDFVASAGLGNHVRFLSGIGVDELADYYTAADAYVQPSTEEGFCLAALESLACGRPVVGTRAGAIPEYLAARGNGDVVGYGVRPLVRAFEEAHAVRVPFHRRKALHAWVSRNFSWDHVVRRTLEVYRETVEVFRRPRRAAAG